MDPQRTLPLVFRARMMMMVSLIGFKHFVIQYSYLMLLLRMGKQTGCSVSDLSFIPPPTAMDVRDETIYEYEYDILTISNV